MQSLLSVKNYILIFFLITETFLLQAQQVHFSHIGVNDGLSQSSVYTIFQDSRGFMWFGTGDGLNRYDGYEIKTYRNDLAPRLISHNNFYGNNASEDKYGNIWFSSRAGIIQYNFKKDIVSYIYPQNDSLRFTGEFIVLGIHNGEELWLSNASDSVFSFNITSGNIQTYFIQDPTMAPLPWFYRNATLDHNGKVWYTLRFGLGCFDIHTHQFKFYLTEFYKKHNLNWTGEFLSLPNGDMILTCYKMALRFSVQQNKVVHFAGDSVSSLFIKSVRDTNGNLWLGSINNGLMCYTADGKNVVYNNTANEPTSISGNMISSLYIDRSNNLWIGVDGHGVDKINLVNSKFELYRSGKNNTGMLGSDFIKCFTETDDGKLLVGTNNGGISLIDRKNHITKNLNPERPFNHTVSCFTKNSKGQIIIGNSLGLSYFDAKTEKVQNIRSGISLTGVHGQTNILSILYTSEKKLLIGTTMGL